MAQIVKQYDLGEQTGKAMRQGLDNALSMFAKIKLQDLMQRQEAGRLKEAQRTGDYTNAPEWAQKQYYSMYPEKMGPEGMYGQPGGQVQGLQGIKTPQGFQQPSSEQELMVDRLNNMFTKSGVTDAGQEKGNAMAGKMGIGMPDVGEGTQQLQQMNKMNAFAPQNMQQSQIAPQQAPTQIQRGPTPYELGFNMYNPKDRRAYAQYMASEQKRIDSKYKKYNEGIDKELGVAETINAKAREALDILHRGKTRSGAMGLLPTSLTFAGPETRNLEKLYEEIAFQKAQEGTGVMSKMKIAAAKATKPSLNMPYASQEYLLNDIINETNRRGIALAQIRDNIVEQNGGRTPDNLQSLVSKEYHRMFPQGTYSNEKNQQQTTQSPRSNNSQIPQESDVVDDIARHALRTSAKIGSGAITGVGNLIKGGAALGDYAAGKVGYKPGLSDKAEKLPFPTSESVAKRLSKWTNGLTDPRSSTEEYFDNIAEMFGSMFMPGATAGKVATGLGKLGVAADKATKIAKYALPFSGSVASPAKMLTVAASGETAKQIADNLGAGTVGQTVAQVGTMLLTGMAGTRAKMGKDAGTLLTSAKQELSSVKYDQKPIVKELTNIKNTAIKESHPYAKEIGDIVDDVTNGMKQKGHSVGNLTEVTKNINSRYGWSLEPKIPGSKFTPKEMRPELGEIVKTIDTGIAKASKVSPAAEKAAQEYFTGKEIYKALNTHGKVTQFFKDNADLSPIFERGHGMTSAIFNLVRGGIGYLGKDVTLVQSLLRQEAGRKAYLKALKMASINNRAGFINAMGNLSKLAKNS